MKDLKYFLSLPYRIELIPDDGGIVARIPDLPGCMSSGDTPAEAVPASSVNGDASGEQTASAGEEVGAEEARVAEMDKSA